MTTMIEGIGTPSGDPFADYAADGPRFDEMLDPQGKVRAHWKPFTERFAEFNPAEQTARYDKLRRLVRENGIAQELFAEVHTADEPWKIDLIPLILSPAEWRHLEKAVIQRARLYSHILNDTYGDQTLLRTGQIPPQLTLGDPAFLRPMSGAPQGRGRLNFFAADFTRDAAGNWRILDNHAETVAGAGFALANRIVHSHVSSDLFRDSRALRLAPYFNAMHGELLTRAGRDDATIALLTPGAHHEDYFGHAYLARYFSFLLVEGGDLRVVSNRIYMKTLEGLRPIDLIMRCVAGAQSDPLQLDPGGYLGPAGFVQALRVNPDLAVNAIGTAVIENRGLGPLLPALCRDVLGEELEIPDHTRWWLGDPGSRQHVLAGLENFAIRRVQEGTGRPGRPQTVLMPSQMSAAELDRLRQEIEIHGYCYVAEEKSEFATLPSWTPEGLRPQGYIMRLYATEVDGEYRVMPGGIALDLDTRQGYALYEPEGRSRDVWVASDADVTQQVSRLRLSLDSPKISRGGTGLRSRIADNLFWLGRYAERADWIMRLLRGALSRLDPDLAVYQHRDVVIRALDVPLAKDEGVLALQPQNAAIERRARSLLSGRGRYGLVRTLDNVHNVASLIRDRLSVELWRTLQTFQTSPVWSGEAEPESLSEALEGLDQGIATLAAFNGMAAENMTRNYGWTFMEIGRRLERAINLSELLEALFSNAEGEAAEAAGLTFALEVADSILTYRSRYLFAPVLPLVLDLLLVDETNPRSVAFQLHAISQHFDGLPLSPQPAPQSEERKMILDLLTRVRLADVHELSKAGPDKSRDKFKALFTHIVSDLPQLSEAITRRYFNLTEDEMKRIYPRVGPRP
ncbi:MULTISPECIES: circularly permuted type 2 ATP-grasp protein [Rhodomicrobium]|uniref:circularly permuted type 2 ATP-grasp protein n=1 Tax=Rhodomicrobium TaxID=1068 RepID=UPI000B4AB179|nr:MULTISPECIES: circularly permuted type 2 ATP-grasp protein [Rhodomicrobium]